MSITSLQAYQHLLDDRVEWLSQSFGDAHNRAVAFVPRSDCPNPSVSINRCVNLFVNYDPRPRGPWGEYLPPIKARRCHDITYLNLTNTYLIGALTNYFEAVLPRELGRTVHTNESAEDGPDISFSYNEAEVKSLAAECAQHFIDNEIKVKVFMPSALPSIPHIYSVATFECAEVS